MYCEKNDNQNHTTVWVNLGNDLIHPAFYFILLTCLYCFECGSAVGDGKMPLLIGPGTLSVVEKCIGKMIRQDERVK
jgi:hypothetical protein